MLVGGGGGVIGVNERETCECVGGQKGTNVTLALQHGGVVLQSSF